MLFPEIEDELRLEKHFQEQDVSDHSSVDVLEANDDGIRWWKDLDEATLEEYLSTEEGSSLADFEWSSFLKVTSRKWHFKNQGTVRLSPRSAMLLRRKAGLSPLFLNSIYEPQHWLKMGDSCFIYPSNKDKTTIFELFYRPHSGWKRGMALLQMTSNGKSTTYFAANYSINAIARLQNTLEKHPHLCRRLFLPDVLGADEGLKVWSEHLSARRLELLQFEREKDAQTQGAINMDTSTRRLHSLSRDWHILVQDLSDTEDQLKFLVDSYQKYFRTFTVSSGASSNVKPVFTEGAIDSLGYLISRCHMYRSWTSNYKDRTNIQINLMFHISSQFEARTNLRIASLTAKVAQQTQRDSTSMITIAAVTMFFLPGTFISAILSTVFFDHGQHHIAVSRQWWIFPALVLPLTIIVFAVWYAWLRWRFVRENASQDHQEEALRL